MEGNPAALKSTATGSGPARPPTERSRSAGTRISATTPPRGGSGICVSGGTTGNEECFARVVNTDATLCLNATHCTHHLIAYERNNGTQMTWGGDSGSPVYSLDEDGNVEVHGTHVGLSRASYGGGAQTFTHYATKYSTIRYSFGGVVRSW